MISNEVEGKINLLFICMVLIEDLFEREKKNFEIVNCILERYRGGGKMIVNIFFGFLKIYFFFRVLRLYKLRFY